MERESEQNSEDRWVQVSTDSAVLKGDLNMPEDAEGIVLSAHGSGSGSHSPQNQLVAQVFREEGLATLLIGLLTPGEEEVDNVTQHLRFDIDLLAERLVDATDWLLQHPDIRDLGIGYLGSSTGAAAALIGATERPEAVGAVVSQGGRPDLVETVLDRVESPRLLIAGGRDVPMIGMNRDALARLRTEKALKIVSGATHLFQEPGALEEVARLAYQWFQRHLVSAEEQRNRRSTTMAFSSIGSHICSLSYLHR
jgi:putative phosphoribosyl transferase